MSAHQVTGLSLNCGSHPRHPLTSQAVRKRRRHPHPLSLIELVRNHRLRRTIRTTMPTMPMTITTGTILPSGPPSSQDAVADARTRSMAVAAVRHASRARVRAKHRCCHRLRQAQSRVAPRYCLLRSPTASRLPPQRRPRRRMNITNKNEVERRRRNRESHVGRCAS